MRFDTMPCPPPDRPSSKREVSFNSEQFLEDQFRRFLGTLPEEQQKVLSDPKMRAQILGDLGQMSTLLPVLERVSRVTETMSEGLRVEGEDSFVEKVLKDRLASACRVALLEAEVVNLRAQIKLDPLTGLANRRGYDEASKLALDQAKETGVPLWCMIADIDDFRHVNSEWGHRAGDQVLKEVGRRLKGQTRTNDVVARIGGEEFTRLVFTDEKGVEKVALRILDCIGGRPFMVRTKNSLERLRVTISLGCSQFKVEGEDAQAEMEERADKNLYMAKRNGKNQAFINERRLAGSRTIVLNF